MSLRPKQFGPLAMLAVLACGVAFPARANLLTGDTIRTWELYPDLSTIYAGPVDVVDPGSVLSFPGFAPIADITFSDANITITMDRDATAYTSAFNGFHFFDVSEAPFGSVTLDAATDVPGIDASRVSFDAQDIYVNFSGITYSAGEEVSLDLRAVPEPKSLLVLLMMAALLTSAVRRGARSTNATKGESK
jgi:hypothetical protein